MLKKIIKHEWRNLRADRTLWAVALLFAVCVGYAMYNGFAWVNFQKRTLAAAAADEREQFGSLGDRIAEYDRSAPPDLTPFADPRNPTAAGRAHGQRYAAMPPAPLAALSVGQSDLLPYYFKISTRSQQTFVNNDEIENPSNLLAGRFDTAFVVIYLLPLLILALSYNFLSGEREAGTLQMLFAQPVGLHSFIAGKIFLRFAVVTVPVVGLALVAFLVGGGSLAAEGALAGGLLWTLAVVAYICFWFALAVVVNAGGWKSATNAVALAGLWLFFVILIPSLANVVVTSIYPVPSRVEMIGAMRDASREATVKGSQVLAKYMEDHPELTGGGTDPNDAARRTYAVQEEVDRQIAPVLARYDEQLERQQNLVKFARFLSPAIVMQESLNDISGTGADRYRHFRRLLSNYHAEWQNYFIPLVFRRAKLTAETYNNSPLFIWREESPKEVAIRVLFGLLGIVGFTFAVIACGLPAIRRYSIVGG